MLTGALSVPAVPAPIATSTANVRMTGLFDFLGSIVSVLISNGSSSTTGNGGNAGLLIGAGGNSVTGSGGNGGLLLGAGGSSVTGSGGNGGLVAGDGGNSLTGNAAAATPPSMEMAAMPD